MSKLSPAGNINVGALLVAAVGLFIIFVSAPDLFPAVPPGVLILAAAAATVAFVPGRWTPIVGVLIPLVITIGGIANGTSIDILRGEENAGAILGTVIQYPALITASAAGTLAMVSDRSSPPSAAQATR
jgi:hypothetical protein